MWGGWSFWRRGAFCLIGRSEATEHSSWIIDKVEAPCCAGRFFMLCWGESGYPRGFPTEYISDFSNISTTTRNISAIISIYRQFDKGYRLIDKLRQKKFFIYPATSYMKGDRLEVRQRYWQIHWWIQLKNDLRISCWTFWQTPALPTNPHIGKSKVSHIKRTIFCFFSQCEYNVK